MAGPAAPLLRAEPRHADALAPLMRRCFLHAYSHASTPDRIQRFVEHSYAVDRLRAELANDGLPTWIIQADDGNWAGFGRLALRSDSQPALAANRPVELQRFYLAPEFHGSGLAAVLMDFLLEQARGHGADAVWLKVWQQAPQAIRFYSKQQFQIVGTAIFMVDDDPKDDWVMGRRVDATANT